MKRSFLAVMSALLFVFCTGCTDSDVGTSEIISIETDSGGNISITENVIGTYDKVLETPQKCKTYNASIKSIEPELMNELFFNGAGEKTADSDSATTSFDLGNKHGFSASKSFVFYTDNGTKFDDAVSYYLQNPNETYMDSTSDLSFSSRESTANNVMNFIEQLGLDRKKTVIKNMYSMKKEGFDFYKDHLTKAAAEEGDDRAAAQAEAVSKIVGEEFYYIDFAFSVDAIPVYSGNPYSYGVDDNDTFAGTKFSLVYTKNGIEYVAAFYLYRKDEVVSDSEIIDFSQAQTLLKNKYDNMFVENEITFYDAELTYLPFPQNTLTERFKRFIMRPYYAFYGTQNVEINGENHTSEFIVFFDAVTGKEL